MQLASGLASFFIFCPLERLSAIPADHIDLTRRPDDGAATGAYMLDTAVLGFFAPALCRAFHWMAAVDVVIFVVLLIVGAVGLGGGLELHTIGQKALKHIFFHCRRGRKSPAGAGLIKSTNWELSL